VLWLIVKVDKDNKVVPNVKAIPLLGFDMVPLKVMLQEVMLNIEAMTADANTDDRFENMTYDTLKLALSSVTELPPVMMLNNVEQSLAVEVKIPETERFWIVVVPAVCCSTPTNLAWNVKL